MSADCDPAGLRVGGFLPFTMVDYPDALAAIIFCQGCPLKCVYCHNPDLMPACGRRRIEWRDIHKHLVRRAGLLDALVFSGGEPLMQSALPAAMSAAKKLGYKIGLHTSGIAPERLREVLPLLDWVGFDVKAPFDRYETITGVAGSGEKARQSLTLLAAAEIPTEVRTTIWPGHVDTNELREITSDVKQMGIQSFAVQEARDPLTSIPKGGEIFDDPVLLSAFAGKFADFTLRRAA